MTLLLTRANGGRFRVLWLAAGLIVGLAAPFHAYAAPAEESDQTTATATTEAEPGKPVALNKFAKRKRSVKVARVQKPRVIAKGYRRKAIEPDAASNVVPMTESDQVAIPASVSNANAQWPTPDTGVRPVVASPTPASATTPIIAATDQLSEADKTAAPTGDDPASQIASKLTAQVVQNPSQAAGVNVPTTATPAMSAMASADRPEVAGSDDNAWSQSSLIGKIFIAFGGLLTVASAARMFMT